MKKKRKIHIVVIVSIILLFPIRYRSTCGTVEYKAILYSITFGNSFEEEEESNDYKDVEFQFFPFNHLDW